LSNQAIRGALAAMAEEKKRVEPEKHIKALAKIWKPKPKAA